MNGILTLILGVCLGTYQAEAIRKVAPILDPNKADGVVE